MKVSDCQSLTIGVVGAGGIAHAHLAAWRHLGAKAVVYSDLDADRVAAQYGATTAPHLDDLLERCDVIDVCTPTDTHHGIVMHAAAAGRDIICEKPLSHRRSEALEMIEACEAAGVQLHPGQVVRYFPEYARAKSLVDAGRIGTPALLRLSRRGARPAAPWFADASRSGGLLVDQMIHDFDYARWLAGEVVQVFASAVDAAPGPTVAIALLTHADGALTHALGGWGHPHESFRTSFSIAGSAGLIRHSSDEGEPLVWALAQSDRTRGELLPQGPAGHSPFVAELADFAAACADGHTPQVSARDSLAALDIALAAARSVETGRPVHLEEVAA